MKKSIYLFIAFACLFVANIKAEEIPFEKGTLKEATAKTQETKKILFVECYTTWCGPCKWMAKNTFSNDTIGKFFNELD